MLERENKMPEFYRKYANDTVATILNTAATIAFLSTLNGCHASIQFTMEIASNNKLPFVGMIIEKKGYHLTTRKPTNTGFRPPSLSEPCVERYKRSLKTMLDWACRLSSSWDLLSTNVNTPRESNQLANIATFVSSVQCDQNPSQADVEVNKTIRTTLNFKDQGSESN